MSQVDSILFRFRKKGSTNQKSLFFNISYLHNTTTDTITESLHCRQSALVFVLIFSYYSQIHK